MPSRQPPFERWTRFRALAGAWERLGKKGLAAGADRVTASELGRVVTLELDALYDELRTGRYRPRPLLCLDIRDGERRREITVPAMRDRLVQEAVRPLLDDALRGRLSTRCHGYVRGRSATTAQHAAAALAATGRSWVHAVDIRDGFGSVDRVLLQQRLVALLDIPTAAVLADLLAAPRQRDGQIQPPPPRGIPLGQPLSPPCFNAYLLPVDRALDGAALHWIRYADDILLLARDESELDRGLTILERELASIGCACKPEKTRRARVEGNPFAYLGRFLAPGLVLEAVPAPPAADAALPSEDADPPGRPPWFRTLYLQQHGAWIRQRQGQVIVQVGAEERQRIPLRDVDRVVVMAGVSFSAPVLATCLQRGIPVHFTLARGRQSAFGSLVRSDAESALLTRSQLEAHGDAAFRLALARSIVLGKIQNSRWLLRRLRAERGLVRRLGLALPRLDRAQTLDQVLGIEGECAALHFRAVGRALTAELAFDGRSRRPPRDPFNSLLSFGYTLLFGELHTLLVQHRLNPFIGYLHALRDNHPALASDLIEEFRAPVVDQLCVRIANLRQLRADDFELARADGAVLMKPAARRRFLELWERRMAAPLCREGDSHELDVRRTMERQVRRLMDAILGSAASYLPFSAATEYAAGAAAPTQEAAPCG